ncbi:MAG: DNA recombination protein RmuC [Pseudomonadota bacterium]
MSPNMQLLIVAGVVVALLVMFFMVTGRIRSDRRRELEEAASIKQRRLELEQKIETLMNSQTAMADKMDALSDAAQKTQRTVLQEMDARVEAMAKDVEKRLNDQNEKSADTLGKLRDRLTSIDEAHETITGLSGQVAELQGTLTDKQARGAIGEVQLADIVRSSLAPSAYAFQASLSNKRRADCLVKLPNPPGAIAIDAKFPLEAYQTMAGAESDEDRRTARTEFKKLVLKHVVDIAERYIVPGETSDAALMFVPSEAAYGELHAHHPDIVQDSFRARVFIVSPTTLMATLNTVRAVLKDTAVREQSEEVQRQAGMMVADVKELRNQMERLQRHFIAVQKTVTDALAVGDKALLKAQHIDDLRLTEANGANGKSRTAAELISDAASEAKAGLSAEEPRPNLVEAKTDEAAGDNGDATQ